MRKKNRSADERDGITASSLFMKKKKRKKRKGKKGKKGEKLMEEDGKLRLLLTFSSCG